MNLHPSRVPIHPHSLAAHPGLPTGLHHTGVMEGSTLQQLGAESPRESPLNPSPHLSLENPNTSSLRDLSLTPQPRDSHCTSSLGGPPVTPSHISASGVSHILSPSDPSIPPAHLIPWDSLLEHLDPQPRSQPGDHSGSSHSPSPGHSPLAHTPHPRGSRIFRPGDLLGYSHSPRPIPQPRDPPILSASARGPPCTPSPDLSSGRSRLTLAHPQPGAPPVPPAHTSARGSSPHPQSGDPLGSPRAPSPDLSPGHPFGSLSTSSIPLHSQPGDTPYPQPRGSPRIPRTPGPRLSTGTPLYPQPGSQPQGIPGYRLYPQRPPARGISRYPHPSSHPEGSSAVSPSRTAPPAELGGFTAAG